MKRVLPCLFLASCLPVAAFASAGRPAATAPPAPASATPAAPAAPAAFAPQATRRVNPAELAAASPVPIWRRNGLLVERGGRALYTYTGDVPGQSRCDARCSALWPPHYAEPGAAPFGPFSIARSFDGKPMWAFQGKPLYRWVSDRKRGDAGGDGVADVWYLVKVPAALERKVTPYFPMPMPRPGRPAPRPAAPAPEDRR